MILAFWTLVISFFLEALISNYIPIHNYFFQPLFLIVALVIIYPYFNHKEKRYLKYCTLAGLFYDIAFTNTLCLYALLFFLLGLMIHILNQWLSNHLISSLVMVFLLIVLYRFFSYGLLVLIDIKSFQIYDFLISVSSSLLLNLVYAILLFVITNFFSKRYKIDKLD